MKKIFMFLSVMILAFVATNQTYALELDPDVNHTGQSITFLGDSITAGVVFDEEYRFPYLVANELGFENYYNMGIGSSAVATESGGTTSFAQRVGDVPLSSDYVVIMGGWNDFSRDIPLVDFETDYQYVVDYLRTNLPNAQIIIMTFFDQGSVATNGLGLTISDYYDVVRNVADAHIVDDGSPGIIKNIQFLDMYTVGDISAGEVAEYTIDNVHLSIKGHRIVANMITSFLAGENLDKTTAYVEGIMDATGNYNFTFSDTYYATEQIPVTPGNDYVFYANGNVYTSTTQHLAAGGAFFTADGTFISGITAGNNLYNVVNAPATADYMILNVRQPNIDQFFVREIINTFTVDFETTVGDDFETILVENEAIIEPEVTEVTGYTFDGWYTDAEFTEEYDFTLLVEDNITLYAKWLSDGTVPDTDSTTGGVITSPTEPIFPLLGLDWYYWLAIGGAAYLLLGTKKGRKSIGLK